MSCFPKLLSIYLLFVSIGADDVICGNLTSRDCAVYDDDGRQLCAVNVVTDTCQDLPSSYYDFYDQTTTENPSEHQNEEETTRVTMELSSKLEQTTIIIGILAGILALALLVIIVCGVRLHTKSRKNRQHVNEKEGDSIHSNAILMTSTETEGQP